jgi:exopolysaccharide biosynthesis protein
MKKRKTIKKSRLICVLIAFIIFGFLFLLYGPYKGFSDMWILTAMHTSEHKFLAKTFYTQSYIDEVIAKNKIQVTDEKTSSGSQIIKNSDNKITLKKITGGTFAGYIMKIDNPDNVALASSSNNQGEKIEDIVKENNAEGGINASGYKQFDFQGIADGISIVNGVMVTFPEGVHHQIVGINAKNKLIAGSFTTDEIGNQNFKWAVEFGPILIINGKKTEMTKMAGGISPRTAIGQTKDGAILLLVIDGRQISSVGASLYDVQSVLYENGAINAFNLDGGASSSMIYKGKLTNSPSNGNEHRNLPNAIIIKTNK